MYVRERERFFIFKEYQGDENFLIERRVRKKVQRFDKATPANKKEAL